MSGFAHRTFAQDVLDANEGFLAKPFLLGDLATRIRELFREEKSKSCTNFS
jgi:DNA-binding response OmpR family regulator